MANGLNYIIESLDFPDILDIARKKYFELMQKCESMKTAYDILLNENKQLQKSIDNLKNNSDSDLPSIKKENLSAEETEATQYISDDEFKDVITETFCSDINESQVSILESAFLEEANESSVSMVESTFFENHDTSPIIDKKCKKTKKDSLLNPIINQSNSITNLQSIFLSKNEGSKNDKNDFTSLSKNNDRVPLVSTENSPKSKSRKINEFSESPDLFTCNDYISKIKKPKTQLVNKTITKDKGRNSKLKTPVLKSTKMKQISVIKCFKKSLQPCTEDVFNFENSDVLNENVCSNLELNDSAMSMNSTADESLQNNEIVKKLQSPIRRKLDFDSSKENETKFCETLNKSRNNKRETTEDMSYLFIRDPVRKKADRKKLQGWACEDCKMYYEGANLTDSQLQAKIDKCSKHRDNRDPFATNTPPGYWNPEFPPTQENNRTQTAYKITSK